MVCAVLALILQGTIFPRVSQRQNGSTVGLNADLENSLQRVESTMMGVLLKRSSRMEKQIHDISRLMDLLAKCDGVQDVRLS